MRAGSKLGEQGRVDEEKSRKKREGKRDLYIDAQKIARFIFLGIFWVFFFFFFWESAG